MQARRCSQLPNGVSHLAGLGNRPGTQDTQLYQAPILRETEFLFAAAWSFLAAAWTAVGRAGRTEWGNGLTHGLRPVSS
jgi:hypothetical protein